MSFYHSTAGLMALFLTYGSFTVMAASSMRAYNPLDPLDTEVTRAYEGVVTPIREHVISFWRDEQASWREKRALAGVYSPEDLKGDIRELKHRITQRDEALQSWEREADTLRTELRSVHASYQEKERASTQRNEALQAQMASLKADHHALELAYSDQQRRLAQLEGHNAALQAAYDRLREGV